MTPTHVGKITVSWLSSRTFDPKNWPIFSVLSQVKDTWCAVSNAGVAIESSLFEEMLSYVFYPAFGNGEKKGAWPRPIMMVKKRKNGTKAAQWISEEPWRSFLGGVWLEQKIGDSLHMGYHTHPNSIQFSKSQRYAMRPPPRSTISK